MQLRRTFQPEDQTAPLWPAPLQLSRANQIVLGPSCYDGPSYDSYLELDRATFFLTQTVVRGMVAQGDLLDHPGVAVRVGEVGEAGVVAAFRVGTGLPAAFPVADR